MAATAMSNPTSVEMQLRAVEVDRMIQQSADFEVAFQMQLAEALSASSFTSSLASSSYDGRSDEFVDIDAEPSVKTVTDLTEDGQIAVTEQIQEMEKLNQEMEDKAEALKEQSRLAEIDAITRHDARFARVLSTLTEAEWIDQGDNLTDPFAYTPDRMYVGRSEKNVIDCERSSKRLQAGSASTSVLCQSDKWEPAVAAAFFVDADGEEKKSYLATIYEEFHVDGRANLKRRSSGTSVGDQLSICGICMEAVMTPNNSLVVSNECLHRFCTECLEKHGETAVKSGKSYVTCPEFLCEELWSTKMSENLLSVNSLLVLIQRQIEDAFPESERVFCPFPDCSVLQLVPQLPAQPSSSSHPHETAVGGVECFSCHRYFCLECKVRWHSDLTCEEFQNLPRDERSPEDIELKGLAKQKLWQRCKKCGYIVELTIGCCHISCRCGNEFCYTCGDNWTSGHLCKS